VRHWVLALVSALVFVMLVIAAGCFAFFQMLEGSMKSSGAYQQAMAQVRRGAGVADQRGLAGRRKYSDARERHGLG
jgi:preprotein translocase subunit YajC